MHYVFTPEQQTRIDCYMDQFKELTGQNLNISRFIEWSINQSLDEAETAIKSIQAQK